MAESQEMAAEEATGVEEDGSPRQMSDGEYMATQIQLGTLAGLVLELDLDTFLVRLEKAEARGPVLDPSLYRRASSQLQQVRRLALAARDFKEVVEEVQGVLQDQNGEGE